MEFSQYKYHSKQYNKEGDGRISHCRTVEMFLMHTQAKHTYGCEPSGWKIKGDVHLRLSFTLMFASLVHTCSSESHPFLKLFFLFSLTVSFRVLHKHLHNHLQNLTWCWLLWQTLSKYVQKPVSEDWFNVETK